MNKKVRVGRMHEREEECWLQEWRHCVEKLDSDIDEIQLSLAICGVTFLRYFDSSNAKNEQLILN